MPKFSKFLLFIFISFVLSFTSAPTYADANPGNNYYSSRKPSQITLHWSSDCFFEEGTQIATLQGFECIYKNLLRVIIPIGGIGAFIVILLGGFQYITSGGDPKQTQKAVSMITGAVTGIAVAVGIWFIFQIINAITGLNLLQFEDPR